MSTKKIHLILSFLSIFTFFIPTAANAANNNPFNAATASGSATIGYIKIEIPTTKKNYRIDLVNIYAGTTCSSLKAIPSIPPIRFFTKKDLNVVIDSDGLVNLLGKAGYGCMKIDTKAQDGHLVSSGPVKLLSSSAGIAQYNAMNPFSIDLNYIS